MKESAMFHQIAYWWPLVWAIVLSAAMVALALTVTREIAHIIRCCRRGLPLGPTQLPMLIAADLALLVAIQATHY
jgi:hypothetical protein